MRKDFKLRLKLMKTQTTIYRTLYEDFLKHITKDTSHERKIGLSK